MSPHRTLALDAVNRTIRQLRWAVGALIMLTIALCLWQHYGMERVVNLTGQAGKFTFAEGDEAHVTHSESGGLHTLQCTVAAPRQDGACSTLIFDFPADASLDLADYSDISLVLDHAGARVTGVVVRLMNADPGYFDAGDWRTYKPVETITGAIPATGQAIKLPLKWFSVATWWRESVHPPVEHSYLRLDHVVTIQVAVLMAQGSGTLTVHDVLAHGKWMGEKALLMVVAGMWIVFVVVGLGAAAFSLRRELEHSNRMIDMLSDINEALQLETTELADQAHTDQLTGALNRQGLRADLIGMPQLTREPLSIIFADIDHFKQVNDTYGHELGDDVLREFAHQLQLGTRAADRVVRWGGEEFLIVCPVTDLQQAAMLAEKLRARLAEHAWPGGVRLSASFGVARRLDAEDIGVVIKRADSMLYDAKRNGRNQVRAHEACAA